VAASGSGDEQVRICPNCGATLDPMRGADLDDLVMLLRVCRDAIDAGRADLARSVLHLVVEHQGDLGVRSRNLAKTLGEQIGDQPPDPRPPDPPT
jgi:hypothetical protein